MTERSRREVEAKPNRSDPSGSLPPPTFKPGLVLDTLSGAFSERRGYGYLIFRTIDGTEFECFVDGIVAKAISDRLLTLAGHMILLSHGEAADLRPLHELGDDDDELPPFPEGVPAMALTPFRETAEREKIAERDAAQALAMSRPADPGEPTEANGWRDAPADIFIDPDKGDDAAGDGTKEKPFRTVGGASKASHTVPE